MYEKILAILKAIGIDITGKEEQLKTQTAELEKDKNGNIDIEKLLAGLNGKGKEPDPVLTAIIEQNKILTQSVKDLQSVIGQEQTARKAAIEAAQAQAKTEQEKKINELIEKAFTDKKIVEADKALYKSLAEKDFDNTSKLIAGMKVAKQFEGKKPDGDGKNTPAPKDILLNGNPGMLAKIKEFSGTQE